MAKSRIEGFEGQSLFRFTPDQIERFKSDPLHRALFATDIGYYPHASMHFVDRPNGSPSHILIHCAGGEGWLRTNEFDRAVKEGEFFVIPRCAAHQYGSQDGWRIYWVHFDGALADEFALRIGKGSYAPVHEPDRVLTSGLFQDVLSRLSSGPSNATLEYMNFSLWRMLGLYALHEELPDSGLYGDKGVTKSICLMKKNLSGRLTLAGMAGQAGLSVSRFSELFRKQTGHSPVDYLIRLKIQRASQLLASTPVRIKEIAAICGWTNPFYFSRIFKKTTGLSPKAYRRLNKV